MDAERLFTYTQRVVIERMRRELTRYFLQPVTVTFWTTPDDLVGVASLCVEGTGQDAGPLVSLLTGPGIKGDGYAVDDADGEPLADGVPFAHAEQVARLAAIRHHRERRCAEVGA